MDTKKRRLADSPVIKAMIDHLYDAAFSARALRQGLDMLAKHIEAFTASYLLVDNTSGEVLTEELSTPSEVWDDLYRSRYAQFDPRLRLADELGEGQIFACHRHFSPEMVKRDLFYQEFLIPRGVRWTLGGKLLEEGPVSAYLGLMRTPKQEPFNDGAVSCLLTLLPHLQRLARMHLAVARIRLSNGMVLSAMDRLGMLVMVTDESGHIHYANGSALALLKSNEGLSSRNGVLTAVRANDRQALNKLIEGAALHASVGAEMTIALQGVSGRLIVRVAPLAPLDEGGPSPLGNKNLALLAISRVTRGRLSQDCLKRLFGLTPREAGLANAISSGKTLEAYANEAKVGMETIKTQLKSVFSKTGTHRQTELALLLASVPQLKGEGTRPEP